MKKTFKLLNNLDKNAIAIYHGRKIFKEILYTCPFLIAPSFDSYHGVRDSGMVIIGKLLKQEFSVA
jgi:hypothetical protein